MRAIDDIAPVPSAPVADLGAERARRRSRWLPIAAAAAFALVVAGGVIVTRNNDSTDVIADVIEADDAEARTFDGDLPGSLRAVFSSEEDTLVIDGAGVAPAGDDLTYQLWLVDAAGARSVGLFEPEPDGRVSVAFAGADPDGFVLGITVEPAGGSTAPTDPIVAYRLTWWAAGRLDGRSAGCSARQPSSVRGSPVPSSPTSPTRRSMIRSVASLPSTHRRGR